MSALDQNITQTTPLVPEERRRLIVERLSELGSVKISILTEEFGISPMTARRDLQILEEEGLARRTHGGAMRLGFAGHEDSFQERMERHVAAKERLARTAVDLLEPGETIFLDASTTAYHVARRILSQGMRATLLTNLVPAMDLFTTSEAPGVELIGIGGMLRKLTLSFVGPHTVETIQQHFVDKVFLSVKGVTPEGYLTDPDALGAEVKREMIKRAEMAILLVDGSKFSERGLSVVAHVSAFAMVLAADAPEERLRRLAGLGVEVRQI